MSKTNIAVLGAGIFMTTAHLPAIFADPTISLCGMWSRSQKTVEELAAAEILADKGPIPTYFGDDGLKELLAREDVQGVIVALPIDKQPEIVKACLKAGKHVLSEKPLAKDVQTAKDLIKTYESLYAPRNLIWRVAENWAHEPSILRAASIIESGALGPVLFYEMRMAHSVPLDGKYFLTPWRTVPNYQGGFLLDGGVHFAAGLRTILGDLKPTQITSSATLHRSHLPPHDTILALCSAPALSSPPHGIDFPSPENPPQGMGVSVPSGTVVISFAAPDVPAPAGFSLVVTAAKGVMTVRSGWSVEIVSKDEEVMKIIPGGKEEFKGQGVEQEVRQFAKAIRGEEGESNKATPRGSLWDLAFIESTLESGGKAIDLGALSAM